MLTLSPLSLDSHQSVKFAIAEQEYLELLETSQTKKALAVLRSKLAPLNHDAERLHQLSRSVLDPPSTDIDLC